MLHYYVIHKTVVVAVSTIYEEALEIAAAIGGSLRVKREEA